jgi:hypothetical protein
MKSKIINKLRKINRLYLIASIAITTTLFGFAIAFVICLNRTIEIIIELNLPLETLFYLSILFGLYCVIVYAIYQIQEDIDENKEEKSS